MIGTKRQRASDGDLEDVGEGLSVEVAGGSGGQGKRSVWERLGGKEGEDEGEEVKTTKASCGYITCMYIHCYVLFSEDNISDSDKHDATFSSLF